MSICGNPCLSVTYDVTDAAGGERVLQEAGMWFISDQLKYEVQGLTKAARDVVRERTEMEAQR